MAQHGPEPHQYRDLVAAIEILHRSEFSERDGLSWRVHACPEIAEFFARNHDTFATPATLQGFARAKPHGYAGDFELIEKIYSSSHSPSEALRRWDEFFHLAPASQAVRNRSRLFSEVVRERECRSVLSVACGPALDVAAAVGAGGFECIEFLDNDPKALDRARANTPPSDATIRYSCRNALRYRPERSFDLVWCSGLFDYLVDRTGVLLLRRLMAAVAPGGALVVGNFHKDNPDRAYMETVGDWLLVHRTPESLRDLAMAAGMAANSIDIRTDATGLNLFLVVERR